VQTQDRCQAGANARRAHEARADVGELMFKRPTDVTNKELVVECLSSTERAPV
jgi:hypothetical protein